MGKVGGAGCTTKKRPRFFKVFFPGLSSKQLEISPGFRKHIRRMRPASTCLLTGPSRKVWCVDMIKNDKGVFFQDGWEEFVQDHSLQVGEFLVFEYEGASRFSVLVFDASMCEKEYASSPSRGPVGSLVLEGAKAKAARGSPAGRCPPRKGASLPDAERKPPAYYKKRYVAVWISQRRPVTELEMKAAHRAASSFKSVNPFLVLVMRKYDVYSGHMLRIPLPFSRQHLPGNRETMTLWDPTGKAWTVNYVSCNGRCFFSGGWRRFALANFLEQGDACVFELIETDELRVHIFRVVQDQIRPLVRKAGYHGCTSCSSRD